MITMTKKETLECLGLLKAAFIVINALLSTDVHKITLHYNINPHPKPVNSGFFLTKILDN